MFKDRIPFGHGSSSIDEEFGDKLPGRMILAQVSAPSSGEHAELPEEVVGPLAVVRRPNVDARCYKCASDATAMVEVEGNGRHQACAKHALELVKSALDKIEE